MQTYFSYVCMVHFITWLIMSPYSPALVVARDTPLPCLPPSEPHLCLCAHGDDVCSTSVLIYIFPLEQQSWQWLSESNCRFIQQKEEKKDPHPLPQQKKYNTNSYKDAQRGYVETSCRQACTHSCHVPSSRFISFFSPSYRRSAVQISGAHSTQGGIETFVALQSKALNLWETEALISFLFLRSPHSFEPAPSLFRFSGVYTLLASHAWFI